MKSVVGIFGTWQEATKAANLLKQWDLRGAM